MPVKIMGLQDVNFVNDAGEKVAGTTIHYCYKDDNVNGMAVDKVFVRVDSSIKIPKGIAPNATATMVFNRKGKLASLQIASA